MISDLLLQPIEPARVLDQGLRDSLLLAKCLQLRQHTAEDSLVPGIVSQSHRAERVGQAEPRSIRRSVLAARPGGTVTSVVSRTPLFRLVRDITAAHRYRASRGQRMPRARKTRQSTT